MAVTVRVEPIRKDIEVMLTELKSDGAAEAFREYAREQINEAKATNQSVLGRIPPFQTFVDGRPGASVESATARSTIVVEFELIAEALIWIAEQLEKFSPVGKVTGRLQHSPGLYKKSHILLADGVEVQVSQQIALAEEYVFINAVPYARKIERGSSSQAPNGVYQAVAALARGRFSNLARITYGFRTVIAGVIVGGRRGNRSAERNPAIIVRMRS